MQRKTLLLALLAVPMAASAQFATYSNVTTFSGLSYQPGGAELQGTNTITRMVVDDIEHVPGSTGAAFNLFRFNVTNLNAAAVSARPRVRFYADNGGTPGTYLAGFSFTPISFAANTSTTYFTTITPGAWAVPAGRKMWAGILFDNNSGGTGATATDLNNLGIGIFSPPTVGTSTDNFFLTNAAGSFLVNNPAGTGQTGAAGQGSFGWAFETATPVPEPGTMAVLGLGLAAAARRRKKA